MLEHKQPEEGGFLRNAGYIQNDVYTLRNNFLTGPGEPEESAVLSEPFLEVVLVAPVYCSLMNYA